jgi:thioredoxin reductase/SAM-dependent methyltransferase
MPAPPAPRRVDVAVIGGGPAGLSAAIQLGRSRRSVIVIDAGAPRNAPAAHMHGFLGHDGRSPQEVATIGRDEARRYGAEIVDGARATVADAGVGRFVVEIERPGGIDVLVARRVVLATGLVDELPDIDGLAQQWGRGVIHCPYCHGWEVRDQRIVVVGTSPLGTHQVQLFRQLSDDVTLVVHAGPPPDGDAATTLTAREVQVIDGPVAAVECDDRGALTGLRLADGSFLTADAVVVAPRFVAATGAVTGIGVVAIDHPSGVGQFVVTDELGQTEVAGLYAAGNVSDLMAQVVQAAAAGARVGAAVNADLAADDTRRAVERRAAFDFWDDRYDANESMWTGQVNDVVLAEVPGIAVGRALDVGCGEGADAIWLAEQGWDVTALEVSQVAIDRGAAAAARVGVDVAWLRGDLASFVAPEGGYDLVSLQYPAIRRTAGDPAIDVLLDAVAPGGTLLVVGHHLTEHALRHAHERGFDPSVIVQPPDVAARLGSGWDVLVDEVRPRTRDLPPDAPHVNDVVLLARRATPGV